MRSRADTTPSFVYAAELAAVGERMTLSREESHYVARVCRARAGDALRATDGRGAVASLEVVAVASSVRVMVTALESRLRAGRAWVFAGSPEGARADWMIEKLAELGVERFVPVVSKRGRWDRSGARRVRWERIAVSALRQSQSAYRLEVTDPTSIEKAIADLPADSVRWLASVGGGASKRADGASKTAIGAIGPSSGFTADEERAFADAGFASIRLAEGRLRTETAAVAWASWWAAGTV
jgi:16S rRNA (uracil1498-N3)-methyltransferase